MTQQYSTTRLLVNEKINFTNTQLFSLPNNATRKGEGGLRLQGYFKKSYPDKPLISIITVVFNGVQHIEKTILSIINQNYDNVEYIIIDGGSIDGSIEIIKKYESQLDYWVMKKILAFTML